MFVGAVFLSHSPLVTGLKGEGAEYEELLSRRRAPDQRAGHPSVSDSKLPFAPTWTGPVSSRGSGLLARSTTAR